MTTTTNATHTGNVHVTAAGQDSVEHVVGDCDVTITPNGTVDITVDLWLSANAFGVYKYLVGQVRRDSVTGASLASYAFGYPAGDSNLGHDLEWSTTFTDSAPTTGRYVLTAQSTPNASDVYSDTHVLTLVTPNAPTVAVPASTVTVSAIAPTLATGPAPVLVAVPVVTSTVAALAPALHVTTLLHSWTADESQQLNIAVDLSGFLQVDVLPDPPPTGLTEAGITLQRVSPVMPNPTLDSNGRPT